MSTAYTPLETLLLFQALRSEGVNSHSVFSRISDQIKGVPLVRNDPSYDHGRLSPDALRELYLGLLKEEVKRDLERELERESLLQNGNVSPASRKRKAPSPSLPTVHEASQHAHLIPQLVMRLYARYRDHAVREIREHERRYDALTREMGEIEAGEWDERLQRRATQSPAPSGSTHARLSVEKADRTRSLRARTVSPAPPSSQPNESKTEVKPVKENKIDSLVNHDPEQPNGTNGHRKTSSNVSLPPLSEMAPHSPRLGIPPTIPGPSPTHSLPPNYPAPFAHPPHGHPVGSPAMYNNYARPPSSQFVPTPPPGMRLPPPSPQQAGASGLRGAPVPQQYYSPQPSPYPLAPVPSPSNDQLLQGYPPPHLQHGVPGYPQPQPYQHNIPPGYPPMPQDGLPVTRSGQQAAMPGQPAAYPPRLPSDSRHPPSAPPTGPRPIRPSNPDLVSAVITALATPPRVQHRPAVWRSERRPLSIKTVDTPLPSPDYEPLSPTLKRSELSGRATRSLRNRDTANSPSVEPETLPKPTRGRGRPKRDRSPLSVVSSTADESARVTRSQSVSTATGAPPTADDQPGSKAKVKLEPSDPANIAEDLDSANDGRVTRKRRGTLQAQPHQPPSKRKRQHSPLANQDDEIDLGTPPPRPTTLMATRNFHKLSGTIMNDINSHKHASYFSNPVRDKDAPGYSSIIKQPRDLKSIRLAIAAGARAVNTATANMDSPATTAAESSGSGTVELERAVDLIPPKGIVNSAQLEKEVLRMFANAVMFNPGDDGMVRDTREMFEDIEGKIREWRGVEKVGERAEEEGEEGKGKRRKL